MTTTVQEYDLLLIGGGLANGLIALRLKQRRPELRVLLLEARDQLGGEHTWSFHDSDITRDQSVWIDPLIVSRWPAYDVMFPDQKRRVHIAYRTITSERFHQILTATLGSSIMLDATVKEISPRGVVLTSGIRLQAKAVIDGRGPTHEPALDLAWQKFIGLELRFERPHGIDRPILMDATVSQTDGYRFVYVLPFTSETALVEDTYYTDGPELDDARVRDRVIDYAARIGTVAAVLRQERGVLPIALGGDIDLLWKSSSLPRSGLRAALFHPTTGYSLPEAVRLADQIAAMRDLSASSLLAEIRSWSKACWKRGRYFRLLNRMLFKAGKPENRYRMLQRFYTMPENTIRRFYAGQLTLIDQVRIVAGRSPVPLLGAARVMMDTVSVRR